MVFESDFYSLNYLLSINIFVYMYLSVYTIYIYIYFNLLLARMRHCTRHLVRKKTMRSIILANWNGNSLNLYSSDILRVKHEPKIDVSGCHRQSIAALSKIISQHIRAFDLPLCEVLSQ